MDVTGVGMDVTGVCMDVTWVCMNVTWVCMDVTGVLLCARSHAARAAMAEAFAADAKYLDPSTPAAAARPIQKTYRALVCVTFMSPRGALASHFCHT